MSVIQSIREKYAKWAVIAIALALLGFLLTDYFQAKNRMGSGNSSTLGLVNGKKIDYNIFANELQARDDQQQAAAQQQQSEYTEAAKHQTAEGLWNQKVEEILMTAEVNKVGIDVGKKEFNDYLFGQNPPADLRQRFSDQQGNYDGAAAQNAINQLKRSPTKAERDQLDAYLASLEYNRKMEKYNSILTNSVYYPKWYVEKQNAEAAGLAKVSFVSYPYSKISDSTIKVSDKEIEEYVSKNKDQFKQTESRSIAYTVFNAAPTAADSAQLRKQLSDLKPEFAADTMTVRFLSRYGSVTSFFNGYAAKSLIQVPFKDSIFALAKNAVYGPYVDQNTYSLAKMIEVKSLPDSVYCRHILFRTTGDGALPDSIAEKRLDSAIAAINAGASFVKIMKQVSMDAAANSQDSLGIMRFSSQQIQETERFDQDFGKYILFDGTKGQKKKVKTKFGYHYIEIVDQKKFEPHYKVAYYAKNIIASDETERVVLEDASKFVSESPDLKTFNANIAKSNGRYQKFEATNISPSDISIQDIDQRVAGGFNQVVPCRRLVKEIYKADKGDVIKQERIGDSKAGYKYIVATVTDVLKEGTQPVSIARTGTANSPSVERILKDKKKAEQIKQMIGKVTTLEAAAATLKDSIVVIDSVRITGASKLTDAKILGAIFNNANKGKVAGEPIAGKDAVYVVRVEDVTTTPVVTADIEMQKSQMRQRAKQMQGFYSSPIKLMRERATIKDYRQNFY